MRGPLLACFHLCFPCPCPCAVRVPHQPTKPEKSRERCLHLCAECVCRRGARGGGHWAGCCSVSSLALPCARCAALMADDGISGERAALLVALGCRLQRAAAAACALETQKIMIRRLDTPVDVSATWQTATIQLSCRHIAYVETKAVPQPLLVSVAKRSQPLLLSAACVAISPQSSGRRASRAGRSLGSGRACGYPCSMLLCANDQLSQTGTGCRGQAIVCRVNKIIVDSAGAVNVTQGCRRNVDGDVSPECIAPKVLVLHVGQPYASNTAKKRRQGVSAMAQLRRHKERDP